MESSTKSDIALTVFISDVLASPMYPGALQNLLIAFDLRGPWDFKWAWWSSPLDDEIVLFNIEDKKSFRRYEAWQAARGMIHPQVVEKFDELSFYFLRNPYMAHQSVLPEEYKSKLDAELEQLRTSLDNRIPEFGIQLQVVLGRLQELPEAAWALTDEQRKTIVDGFKQNANVVVFREAKTTSIKNHKIKGPISPDMF